jgi:CRISPR-associated protein Cmr2
MSDYLFIVQLGPVQSFIAQSRRTADLYTSSRILSMLATAGVTYVAKYPSVDLISPSLVSGKLPKSVPHRFTFKIKDVTVAGAQSAGEQVEAYLRHIWWDEYGAKVGDWLLRQVGDGAWVSQFKAQTESWLEVYWYAVEITSDDAYDEAYRQAGKGIAARKATRQYPQLDDTDGYKCTMTGSISALPLNWEALQKRVGEPRLRDNERLGAIAMIKRFATDAGCLLGEGKSASEFPAVDVIAGNDTPDEDATTREYSYLAVLHMDGDSMGKLLSGQKTQAAQTKISQDLSTFSEGVEPIIQKMKDSSELIYAGGDDVLAFLKLDTALTIANEIRHSFEAVVKGTISAGITIMNITTPLDIALESARKAEEMAKDDYGRDAIVIRDIRSGAIREVGAHWKVGNHELTDMITFFQKLFKEDKLSSKIGYEVLTLSMELSAKTENSEAALSAELSRLIKRRSDSGKSLTPEETKTVKDYIHALAKAHSWKDAANWLIMARFLAKGGKRA